MHRYNKLLLYLDELTSEAQCAFYLGRLITDNAIIKFDFPHKIQQSRHPWDTHCAYRLDLAEAYADIDRSIQICLLERACKMVTLASFHVSVLTKFGKQMAFIF